MTTSCQHWEEDLALLAGGDLPSVERESEVLAHVESCASCARLLEALGGDQVLLVAAREASAAAGSTPLGLADRVLESLERPAAHRASRAGARGVFAWATAAAALLVATVALVRTPIERAASWPDDAASGALERPVATADDRAGAPLSDTDGLPVQVRRVAGQGVELTWAGDGREGRSRTVPYRVLASASPRDFTEAQAIEVAGEMLVATAQLPATRMTDRKVTYFRVQ